MMESVANGLTKQMRENLNSTAIHGAALTPTVFVKVRWPWFAYPVTLAVLSAMFLAVTIIFSLEGDKLVWKSSSIALLFHPLEGFNAEELEMSREDEMEAAAEKLQVRLTREDGGIRFIRL